MPLKRPPFKGLYKDNPKKSQKKSYIENPQKTDYTGKTQISLRDRYLDPKEQTFQTDLIIRAFIKTPFRRVYKIAKEFLRNLRIAFKDFNCLRDIEGFKGLNSLDSAGLKESSLFGILRV